MFQIKLQFFSEQYVASILVLPRYFMFLSRIHHLLYYRFVGKLVGRYYDAEGNPTKYLKGVEVKAARGAQLLEKQKEEEAKVVSCNSRWSQEEGSEV